ncbi:aminoglycoside phosphotransferase family protein [Desulfomarina sp.]
MTKLTENTDDPFIHYQHQVEHYLRTASRQNTLSAEDFTVHPLARGEYNLNYLLRGKTSNLVFRVNMGTQINRDDQILYEFNTLKLLKDSGVTPIPVFADDSRKIIDRGILVMEYLPGCQLDYRRDIKKSARVFAAIHQIIPPDKNHLIRETRPLSAIFAECLHLVEKYLSSELAVPEICRLLEKIIAQAEKKKGEEQYFIENPWLTIVNTEVNSGNFIVNRKTATTHLVDWEMARLDDPSSDLCHFISPLTTLWKTGYRFTDRDTTVFFNEYKEHIKSEKLRKSLLERIRIKAPFVLLRGISWSAMAWVGYQGEYSGIRNKDTWQTLQRYMDEEFIRTLFSSFLNS